MPGDPANHWTTREDLNYRTISYAQNHEDILLDRVFGGGGGYRGFYVDIGANHPVFHSVTKLLYDRGWCGVNVEPSPSLHQELSRARPRDVNLNLGVADVAGVMTFFEVASPRHGWSTFMPEMAAAYHEQGVATTERKIEVATLGAIFAANVDRTVDVLKVDVEGLEQKVIAGLDWDKWRPRVVLVEATWADLWEHILLSHAYGKVAFDGINNFYVRSEDAALGAKFATPVNILDNFIPHEILRLVDQPCGNCGSSRRVPDTANSLKLARKLHIAARRHPLLVSTARRILNRMN